MVMDLSELGKPEPKENEVIVHDTLITDGGGVIAMACPACEHVYMVAFQSGSVADWVTCHHCQESRARVKGEKLQVEKSRGVAKA